MTPTSVQIPLPLWIVAAWWAFTVMSAAVAMLLLLLYENWAVRRGFRAWGVLATGDGEITTPSWHKLWWWILLSSAALIGGIVGNILLQQAMLR